MSEAPAGTAAARRAQADVPLVLRALAAQSGADSGTDGMGVVLVEGDAVVIVREPGRQPREWLVVEVDRQAAPPPPRRRSAALTGEWVDLLLSCGGAAVSGAGAAGSVIAAPETGGLSALGTAYLVSQTAVAAGQCGVEIYRVTNIYRGHEDINEAMDRSPVFSAVMYAADAYALMDVANVGRESMEFLRGLDEANVSLSRMLGDLNRNERLRLTRTLGLQGARRVAAAKLNAIARTRIVQAIGGAFATAGSLHSGTGVLHAFLGQVRIWALREGEAAEPGSGPSRGGAIP
jgi:hypothetical protein